ncbi:MAG: DUF1572 family protein [Spirosomataceae bacterium]
MLIIRTFFINYMITDTLIALYERDLNTLKRELLTYQSEENLWKTQAGIANSAGNLALHLIGNLNTYIGAQIGKTGYVRNRPLEFSAQFVSREQIIKNIDDTIEVIKTALTTLTQADYDAEYPILVFEKKTSTEYFLIHLAVHLGYHLGQVNYHRRLLDLATAS